PVLDNVRRTRSPQRLPLGKPCSVPAPHLTPLFEVIDHQRSEHKTTTNEGGRQDRDDNH
ncbi:MAG: hypothetical protein ACI8TP_005253, partial [Acidimicrobiales bacterium]